MRFDERAAGAVVVRKTGSGDWECVLIRQHNGDWGLPKGHVERGESDEQAAVREVKEETGLSVELDPVFRQAVRYTVANARTKEVVYFLGRPAPGELVGQAEEIAEIGWYSFEEAVKKVRYAAVREVLHAAQRFLAGPSTGTTPGQT